MCYNIDFLAIMIRGRGELTGAVAGIIPATYRCVTEPIGEGYGFSSDNMVDEICINYSHVLVT